MQQHHLQKFLHMVHVNATLNICKIVDRLSVRVEATHRHSYDCHYCVSQLIQNLAYIPSLFFVAPMLTVTA